MAVSATPWKNLRAGRPHPASVNEPANVSLPIDCRCRTAEATSNADSRSANPHSSIIMVFLTVLPRVGGRVSCGRVSARIRSVSRKSTSRACFSTTGATCTSTDAIVDLRSDTVTKPTREMLECALTAPIGDDVMGEDPTVTELEEYAADMFGKECGLFVGTGTMSNLCAISSHCHERASEIIIGSSSHINLYEGGNAANLGGVHTKQIPEDPISATLDLDEVRSAYRHDNDDHYAKTALVCLENTHNILGGVVLPKDYIDEMGRLANNELGVPLHIDGARIMNAAISLDTSPSELCAGAASISICLSKGLGAPLGSVLVGESEFIRLARRARKRCGGGMRQAGVVASMGLYALQNNVQRLAEDHIRAKRFAHALGAMGFLLPRDGQVDTNLVFFALPKDADLSVNEFCERLDQEYGVLIGGGYSRPGERSINYIRAATNMGVDDDGIERALEGIERILSDGGR